MLDVGHGDAIVLNFAGTSWLVDAGPASARSEFANSTGSSRPMPIAIALAESQQFFGARWFESSG